MTAWRARAGLLVALGLVASGAVALMSGTAAAGSTTPSLECVYHDTGTGQYNALWGYTNWYFFPDYEPIGGNNSFWPYPSNRGQPTTFQTGNRDNVFVTTWNGSGGLTGTWTATARPPTRGRRRAARTRCPRRATSRGTCFPAPCSRSVSQACGSGAGGSASP